MKIKKGQKIRVTHSRKGNFDAIAKSDFDTEKDERYDVVVDEDRVVGIGTFWNRGEDISCRRRLCKIELRK